MTTVRQLFFSDTTLKHITAIRTKRSWLFRSKLLLTRLHACFDVSPLLFLESVVMSVGPTVAFDDPGLS